MFNDNKKILKLCTLITIYSLNLKFYMLTNWHPEPNKNKHKMSVGSYFNESTITKGVIP